MTERPIVPRSPRFSVYAAVTMVLVMVAVLLADKYPQVRRIRPQQDVPARYPSLKRTMAVVD